MVSMVAMHQCASTGHKRLIFNKTKNKQKRNRTLKKLAVIAPLTSCVFVPCTLFSRQPFPHEWFFLNSLEYSGTNPLQFIVTRQPIRYDLILRRISKTNFRVERKTIKYFLLVFFFYTQSAIIFMRWHIIVDDVCCWQFMWLPECGLRWQLAHFEIYYNGPKRCYSYFSRQFCFFVFCWRDQEIIFSIRKNCFYFSMKNTHGETGKNMNKIIRSFIPTGSVAPFTSMRRRFDSKSKQNKT